MASETNILEALFGPSIPTEKAAILPEIMAHIRAIDDLLLDKPRQRKALQDHKTARGPEIPPDCNRAQLDAVMWQLWAAMVERRLRQQGAEL